MRTSFIVAAVTAVLLALTGLVVWLAMTPSTTLTNRIVALHPSYEEQLDGTTFVGDWRKGAGSEAPVQVLEYADFQCPGCAGMAPLIEEAISRTSEYASLVYRHYPLPQHNKARLSARAAEAAGRQGKFWEMNQIIFSQQQIWQVQTMGQFRETLSEYARSLGINVQQFETDLNDSSIDTKILRDQKSGDDLGVSSTPSIFINGTRLERLPTTADELVALIQAARDAKQ